MTPEQIAKLPTPLTDKAKAEGAQYYYFLARKWEQDRAALMESLELYQHLFFGRHNDLSHMTNDQFREAHSAAFTLAIETLSAVRQRQEDKDG